MNARLEAELKQKQMKLRLYRSLQQAKNRQELLSSPNLTSADTRDSPKKSKLAEVLMGQSSGLVATSSARTTGSAHASGLEVDKPIVDHSSDTDSGELVYRMMIACLFFFYIFVIYCLFFVFFSEYMFIF